MSIRVRLALIGIGVGLLLLSPLWAPLLLRRLDYFRVRRVEVLGAHYVAPSDILTRLHVDTTASVWDPIAPLTARVASHPEVQRAVVRRKLPGTLVIEVIERVPVALVPASEGFRVFDERGNVLPIDPSSVGVDAPILAARDTSLLRLLGEVRAHIPHLYGRLSEVRRVGADELVLRLKDWPVRTMQNVTVARLADLAPVEDDLTRKQLRVAEIDLRFRDQVIARLQ